MPTTVAEFLLVIQSGATAFFPGGQLTWTAVRSTRVKARLDLAPDCFVDIFFREETQRTDYALIVAGQRVYGLDNLGGWHEHPLHDPASHVPCPAVTPAEAFQRLRDAADSLQQSGATPVAYGS